MYQLFVCAFALLFLWGQFWGLDLEQWGIFGKIRTCWQVLTSSMALWGLRLGFRVKVMVRHGLVVVMAQVRGTTVHQWGSSQVETYLYVWLCGRLSAERSPTSQLYETSHTHTVSAKQQTKPVQTHSHSDTQRYTHTHKHTHRVWQNLLRCTRDERHKKMQVVQGVTAEKVGREEKKKGRQHETEVSTVVE